MKKLLMLLLILLVAGSGMLFAGGEQEDGEPAGEATGAADGMGNGVRRDVGGGEYTAYNITTGQPFTVTIDSFAEAPQLAAMVDSGELPPVDERLPEEPLVLEPIEEIGTYGGTEISARTSNLLTTLTRRLTHEFLLTYSSPYLDEIYPNVAKSFEVNEDSSEFTFTLRRGMKWSDGEPFTADDILFWYEDIIMNDDLYPAKPGAMVVNGEVGVVDKIDEVTVRFTFSGTNAVFIQEMARWRPEPYAPKHYLSQFHPNYASEEDIQELMQEEGYDVWSDFFFDKWDLYGNPDSPVLGAWMSVNSADEQIHVLERNPYYWKIDTAGNQLPYIDRSEHPIVQDREAWFLSAMAGELTHAMGPLIGGRANYPLLMQNRERGDYRVVGYPWPPNTYASLFMNYEHEDENLRELFMDFRFREALSVSLNRQEVNELIFDGDATPSNISPTEGPPHHGEDPLFKETYLQYDPDRANQLLDEIGLTNRDSEGFRTFEDGSQLTISLLVGSWTADDPEIAEMYRQYWSEVGLRVVVRNQSAELIGQAMQAGEYDMRMSSTAAGGRPMNIFTRGALMPLGDGWTIQPEWGAWAGTNGAEGAEPPDSIKRLREIYEEGIAEPDADRRIALVREAFEIVINNQWVIGGLNQPQTSKYRVFQNSLRNVHVEGEMNPTELYPSQPAQWYLRQ